MSEKFEPIDTGIVDELIKRIDEQGEKYEKDMKLICETLTTITKHVIDLDKKFSKFRDEWEIGRRAARF